MKIRIISNARIAGGGEMSVCTIARMLVDKGHDVSLVPTGDVGEYMRSTFPGDIDAWFLRAPKTTADVLLLYANNFTLKTPDRAAWSAHFRASHRRVMCLNFDIGYAAQPWFSRHWHEVLFLNSTKQVEFGPHPRSRVLAPPVDLTPFLAVTPDYTRLWLARHNRPNKLCDDMVRLVCNIHDSVPDSTFVMMGVPVGIGAKLRHGNLDKKRFRCFKPFSMPVANVLELGSCFWYRLSEKMRDQGPRVVVEAMAAGLPCIVDDRDGARDRVTDETGWRCKGNEEYVRVVKMISGDLSVLREKGQAARQRAINVFDPQKWVDHILG